MALISAYVDKSEIQPGVFQNTINMKPIAYLSAGALLPMAQDFVDGDVSFPNIVTRAPLRLQSANDGSRRMFPVQGDDTKYIEIGAPFVKVGGVWTQVSLGTPTRNGKIITWTRPQTITTVTHAGHYIKLEIELRNGFVPEGNLIAFPASLSGLTRSGTAILDGSNVVANLRPFVIYDAANPLDVRAITHQFTNLSGNPYLLLTLPALTGMSRPVIDPTLSLQPDATAGIDTFLYTGGVSTNYGTHVLAVVGNPNNEGALVYRELIKFDLSSLPSNATISAATLSLYATTDVADNASTYRVYRQLKAWTESGATWNKYDGTTNWTTAGGFDAADCEQTDIGSRAYTATETLNAFKDFSLTPTTKSGLDNGNGWLVKSGSENKDAYYHSSSDATTAANRPKFVVVYTVAAGAFPFQSRPLYVWNRKR